MTNMRVGRSYKADQHAKRRELEKHLKQEIPEMEASSRKRYVVEVDAFGMPIGRMRHKWLASLRGHNENLDLSVDS